MYDADTEETDEIIYCRAPKAITDSRSTGFNRTPFISVFAIVAIHDK